MAKTPWEMAAVGKEFSHQTALFAWSAMAQWAGAECANDPLSYTKPGHAKAFYIADRPLPVMPQLKWLHSIKNQGHGDAIRGSRSKAEGVREGVFDLCLPLPLVTEIDYDMGSAPFAGAHGVIVPYGDFRLIMAGYHGLYIELKTPDRINHKDGGASQPQLDFQADMRAAGYAAEVCHGWEAARDCLLTYLGKSPAH